MRTKLAFLTMALPALFAACTSEEFAEPIESTANGRALLNPNFSVDLSNDASTRFAWENYKWGFSDGDKFGTALTDPTTLNTVVETHMLGNYIFTKEGGEYKTNSRMTEGTYIFYSYPDFQNKNDRKLVDFDLGKQTTDLNKPEELINNTQLFFSPLYKLEAKNSDIALPLKFYPYWSTAAFKIKNTTGAAFKISQIILKGTSFTTKGEISPTELNSAKLIYSVDGTEYKLASGAKDVLTVNIAKEDETKETASMLMLNCQNYELGNNEEIVAYMNVPAGKPGSVSVEIIVNVDGVSKKIAIDQTGSSTAIGVTGINDLTFSRGKTMPVFGQLTDGGLKTLSIKEENLGNADGFYTDNKADLLSLINNNLGALKVYNMGELAIDDDLATAMGAYSGTGITFVNPITIKTTKAATIEKVTFSGGVKVEGDVTFNTDTKLASGKVMDITSGNVTLKAGTYTGSTINVNGGKVTLKDGTYTNTINVVGGELVLAKADLKITAVAVGAGTLTLVENQSIGADNIVALTFDAAKTSKFNIAAEKTLTVSTDLTLEAKTTTTVHKGASISVADTKTLTNNGTLIIDGAIGTNSSGSVVNAGDIEIAGSIDGVTNKGHIELTDAWYSKVKMGANGTDGLINNTIGGTVDLGSTNGNTTYRVYTGTNPQITGIATDVAVLKDVTFTENQTITPIAIMLGNTEIKADVTVSTSLFIGVESTHQAIAERVLGKTFDDDDAIKAYNAGVGVKVYDGAKLTSKTAYAVGKGVVTLLNRGVVTLPNGASDNNVNAWGPTVAVKAS